MSTNRDIQAIFDDFIKQLKAMQPRIEEIQHPLTKDPRFHDLSQDVTEDRSLRLCRAAYNLALTIKIAFTPDISIFSPAPVTVSKDLLIKELVELDDINQLTASDHQLMQIFYPILKFTSANIESIVPWGAGLLAARRIKMIKDIKEKIGESLDKLRATKQTSQVVHIQHKEASIEDTIKDLEEQYKKHANELDQVLRKIQDNEELDDEQDKLTFKNSLADVLENLINVKQLKTKRNEALFRLAEIEDEITTLSTDMKLLQIDSFQRAVAKGNIPVFNDEIAKFLNLDEEVINSWIKYSDTLTGENRLGRYVTTKASDFIGYLTGELTSTSILNALRIGADNVTRKFVELNKQRNSLARLVDKTNRAIVQAEGIHLLAKNIHSDNGTEALIIALNKYLELIKPKQNQNKFKTFICNASGKTEDYKNLKAATDLIKINKNDNQGIKRAIKGINSILSDQKNIYRHVHRLFQNKATRKAFEHVNQVAKQLISLK